MTNSRDNDGISLRVKLQNIWETKGNGKVNNALVTNYELFE